jgi:hypothetical protein
MDSNDFVELEAAIFAAEKFAAQSKYYLSLIHKIKQFTAYKYSSFIYGIF